MTSCAKNVTTEQGENKAEQTNPGTRCELIDFPDSNPTLFSRRRSPVSGWLSIKRYFKKPEHRMTANGLIFATLFSSTLFSCSNDKSDKLIAEEPSVDSILCHLHPEGGKRPNKNGVPFRLMNAGKYSVYIHVNPFKQPIDTRVQWFKVDDRDQNWNEDESSVLGSDNPIMESLEIAPGDSFAFRAHLPKRAGEAYRIALPIFSPKISKSYLWIWTRAVKPEYERK